jgi:hypothetical protein
MNSCSSARVVACRAPRQARNLIQRSSRRAADILKSVRDMIAAMFPNVPKLEMFARGQRVEGWNFWSNEVPPTETAPLVVSPFRLAAEIAAIVERAKNKPGEAP